MSTGPRKVQRILDYFTPEGAAGLVAGAPSYPTRMVFAGLRRILP